MARDRIERERHGEAFPAKIKRRSAKPAKPAYASIPMSQLATQRLRRLSGDAVRVLLIAHATWTPKVGAPLPITFIAKALRMSKLSTSAAIRLLQPDILTLRAAAIRPATMGSSARGSAAIYEVAGRRQATAHRVFEPGDRRFDGSFRIECADLRRLAAMLSDAEARILICAVLPCDRDKHGNPQRQHLVALSGRGAAKVLPGLAARTADAAIQGLTTKGLLREVAPAAGCRAAIFEPAGLASSTVRRGRQGSSTASLPMHGVLHGGNHSAHKRAGQDVEMAVSRGVPPAPEGVVRSHETMDPGLRAATKPGNNQRVRNDAPPVPDLDIAAALRLVAAGPAARDTGRAGAIPYRVGTTLLAREWITVASRPIPGGDGKTFHRVYEITPAGRVALAKQTRAAA